MTKRPGPDAPSSADPGSASFETALGELEAIVDRLEQGDLELEQALAAFEQGVSLARRCARQLEEAERRIEVLLRDGDDWVVRPFSGADEASDAPEESEEDA